MPVTVNASLSRSRWPIAIHSFAFLLTSLFSVQLLGHGYFILVLLVVFGVSYRRSVDSPASHIQWLMSQVSLTTEHGVKQLTWAGIGRQSYAFIKLELQGETGRQNLVVWKDQVSDASWRALNMAFTVWQPTVLAQERPAKTLPSKTIR